jgi:hypothetical protein
MLKTGDDGHPRSPGKGPFNLDRIKEICEANDRKILESLGFFVNPDGSVVCPCPIHEGDNQGGFSYCPHRKVWRCWTQHCHEETSVFLTGLVQAVRGITFHEAVEYILGVTNESMDARNYNEYIKNYVRKNKPAPAKAKSTKVYPESILPPITGDIPYLLNRGFTKEILSVYQAFQVDYKPESPLSQRACFPIRNNKDEIVAFAGRTINDRIPKWKYSPQHSPVGSCLFGFNLARPFIADSRVVVIVEGSLDAVRLKQLGVDNAVAVLGNKISDDQVKMLATTGVRTLIVCFDPDDGGRSGVKNVVRKCRLFFNVVDISEQLPKDPGDLDQNEVDQYIKPTLTKWINTECQKQKLS